MARKPSKADDLDRLIAEGFGKPGDLDRLLAEYVRDSDARLAAEMDRRAREAGSRYGETFSGEELREAMLEAQSMSRSRRLQLKNTPGVRPSLLCAIDVWNLQGVIDALAKKGAR